MLDHVSIGVKDFKKSRDFYQKVFKELGFKISYEDSEWVGFGSKSGESFFWLNSEQRVGKVHIAFLAKSRRAVDSFYDVALRHGAKDNGKPGIRPYHENYYAAYIIDLDGNNVEAVCHGAK